MPYIASQQRPELDAIIDQLPVSVAEPGQLNYVITRIIMRAMGMGTCYRDICTIMGTLDCVGKEFYRRVASRYEDRKIEENGDVY